MILNFVIINILLAIHKSSCETKILECQKGKVLHFFWGLNTQSSGKYHEYSKKLVGEYLPQLVTTLNELYPGSKFGIFSWTHTTNLNHILQRRSEPKRFDIFDSIRHYLRDAISFTRTIKRLKISKGGSSPELTFGAIHMLAKDESMWGSLSSTELSGNKIVKIIMLSTDDYSSIMENTEFSQERLEYISKKDKLTVNFKSFPMQNFIPSLEQISDVLLENDVALHVFALKEIFYWWLRIAKYFEDAGVVYSVSELNMERFVYSIEAIINLIQNTVCKSAKDSTMVIRSKDKDKKNLIITYPEGENSLKEKTSILNTTTFPYPTITKLSNVTVKSALIPESSRIDEKIITSPTESNTTIKTQPSQKSFVMTIAGLSVLSGFIAMAGAVFYYFYARNKDKIIELGDASFSYKEPQNPKDVHASISSTCFN